MDNEEIFDDGTDWGSLLGSATPDKAVKCVSCKWEGTLKQTHKRAYRSDPQSWRSLGGREGNHYHCPKCDFVVFHDYWLVS